MVKKSFNPIRLTLWIPGVQADKRVKKMENEGDMNSKDKGTKIEIWNYVDGVSQEGEE